MEKFKQLVGETYDEDVVRNRLDQIGISHKYIWGGAGTKYGVRCRMDGVDIKAYVELVRGKYMWHISTE